MNKTAQTELYRLFLIEKLPEPLIPASAHLQLFDNYIENTRIRLRKIRDPYSKAWTHILQQRFMVGEGDAAVTKLAEIHLNDNEYRIFERFEGREIRKNRYYHEFDGQSMIFDVYLGNLWGFCTAKIEFETHDRQREFMPPPFAVYEITGNEFFYGSSLVGKQIADLKAVLQSLNVGEVRA